MHLGTQLAARHDDDYRVMAQLGVNHVCADPPGPWTGWSREALARHKAHVEGFGLKLAMIQLPLPSLPVDRAPCADILLAGPQRDAQIAAICRLIEDCAAVGIGAVKYNFNYLGVPRTPPEPGRGGARAEAFRLPLAKDGEGPAGPIEEAELWRRLEYFLARVVPVAQAAGVQLACHPHDPATPPGYLGLTRILGSVEGLKRFVGLHDSPVHGLNFCIGTLAEMVEDPSEVPTLTRWFAERGRVMNVHFRNIAGRRYDFRETFPEEGDVDMPAVLQVLHECGYDGMVMPDHAPQLAGENQQQVAFAFCYGYIAALLQQLERRGDL